MTPNISWIHEKWILFYKSQHELSKNQFLENENFKTTIYSDTQSSESFSV